MKNREFTSIGEGVENVALRVETEGRETDIVMKKPSGSEEGEGFTLGQKQLLEKIYTSYKRRFGDYIPRQRFLRNKKNGQYYIIQEKINLAKKASLFDYGTAELQPETLEQLERLLDLLKESYYDYLDNGNSDINNRPLDIYSSGNLLVDSEGDIKAIDTGFGFGSYEAVRSEEEGEAKRFVFITCRIFLLDVIAGRKPSEIINERVYEGLEDFLNENCPELFADGRLTDDSELITKILKNYKYKG